ncbi:MAG: YihY/virulence factor BrkB family protein [Betaproteobacteria bacterium]
MNARDLLQLVKKSAGAWVEDSAPSKGAALAYYATFSIAPLLFIAISIAGIFFGVEAVQGAVFAQLADLMGENGAKAIQEMLAHVQEPKTGMFATIVGAALLLLGASTVFGQLQSALDDIWDAPQRVKPKGVWEFLRARLLSFGMVLAVGFLILVSLLFSTAIAAMGKWWGGVLGDGLGHVIDLAVSFGLLTAAFAVIYKYIPSVRIEWRDVWVGAAVTALLFTIGKWAIGVYLGKSDVASSFGAFGSLVIVMVWVYYSAQIFLLGAEFTWMWSHDYGSQRARREAERVKHLPVPMGPPLVVSTAPPRPARMAALQRYPGIALAGALIAGLVVRVAAQRADWRSLRRHIFG